MSVPEVPPERDLVAGLGPTARMLVSDADRGRFAGVLGDAFAEGRLTPDEYEERLSAAMGARTVADLVPVLADLPPAVIASMVSSLTGSTGVPGTLARGTPGDMALGPAATGAAGVPSTGQGPSAGVVPGGSDPAGPWYAPAGPQDSSAVVAIFGGATRKGEWVVPAQLTAFAMFGGVELDLTRARFTQGRAELTAVAVMGGVEITVPEGLAVSVDGVGIFGGFDQKAAGPGLPGAPELRITGAALFGGVEVKRKPRRRGRDAGPSGIGGGSGPSGIGGGAGPSGIGGGSGPSGIGGEPPAPALPPGT